MKKILILTTAITILAVAGCTTYTKEKNVTIFYEVPTTYSEVIFMKVQYKKPNPDILHVDFISKKTIENGELEYTLPTNKEQWVKVFFSYNNNKLAYVKFDVQFPPSGIINQHQETYTVLSKNGHEIDFVFDWRNGNIKNVRVVTKNPPFNN